MTCLQAVEPNTPLLSKQATLSWSFILDDQFIKLAVVINRQFLRNVHLMIRVRDLRYSDKIYFLFLK